MMDTENGGGKSKKSKAEFRSAALKERWHTRLQTARSTRNDWLKTGNDIHQTIVGSLTQDERLKERERYQQENGLEMHVPWPKMTGYVNALVPTFLRQNGDIRVRPLDPSDDVSRGIARCQTRLIAAIQRDNRRTIHNRLVAYQGLTWGVGATVHGFDKHARRSFARYQSVSELLMDSMGTQAPGTMQWMGYEQTVSLDMARKQWGNAVEANTTASFPQNSEMTASQREAVASALRESRKLVRVSIVYEAASQPYDEDRPLTTADYEPDENGGFSGKDRVLVFDAENGNLLNESPWGFVLERGQFPITLFTPCIDPDNVWSYSAMNPVRRLQNLLDFMMSCSATDMLNASRQIVGINEDSVEDAEKFVKDLKSLQQRVVARMKGALNVDTAISSKPLTILNENSLRMVSAAGAAFDEATNRPGLMSAQGTEYSTATAAEIGQRRTNLSIANYQIAMETTIAEQSVKDLQIALSTMNGEDVKLLVSKDIGPLDPTTGEYAYWPEGVNIRQIRTVDVFMRPNSSLETSDGEQARTILETMKTIVETVSAGVNGGLQINPDVYANLIKEPLKAAVRRLDLQEVEDSLDTSLSNLFQQGPSQLPPEQQPATKGEVMQGQQAMMQQVQQVLQQMQQQFAQAFQQMQQVNVQQGQMITQLGQTVAALAKEVQGMSGVVIATAERAVDKDENGDTIPPSGAEAVPVIPTSSPTVPPAAM